MSGSIKQVIVWRADLSVRKGKFGGQIAHASTTWIANALYPGEPGLKLLNGDWSVTGRITDVQRKWLATPLRTKIVVRVDSEAELLAIRDAAIAAGLDVHLITDAGLTEFHGVPTNTCFAIGPDESEKIDAVTGKLALL